MKELIMPRPVTRGTYNNCSECNIKMKDVAFTRSVAKLCPDCRGDIASNNIEVRKIYKELKQNAITNLQGEYMTVNNVITEIIRLHQITAGFFKGS